MSTGSIIFPPGYTPLYNGSPVPSGKLSFFRTGTGTAQNVYAESTLTTPLANPLDLDAAGMLDQLVYFAPDSGFDYRVELLTSASASLWIIDDIVVPAADAANYSEGSFTGSITGCTAAVTGTVSYRIFANSAGTGKVCRLYAASAISGTSNTTAMTMTGLPAACTPSVDVRVPCEVVDNTGGTVGLAWITAAATTIVFATDVPYSTTGFTNSGTKGVFAGFQIEYAL